MINTDQDTVSFEIWHKRFNLDGKDNLAQLPSLKAVYAVFGIVDKDPVNCRFVGEAEHLGNALRYLFENADDNGLKTFLQGPWIKVLKYWPMPDSTREEREQAVMEWKAKYVPGVDENGEYPGYGH